MLVSNHVLAGSAIALAIKQPAAAIPLALVSHFVLDALPHFGYHRRGYTEVFKHRLTYVAVGLDIVGVALLVATVATINWLTFSAALVAALPDTGWLYRYFYYERHGIAPKLQWYVRFHDRIQWGERPWGIFVDFVFFVTVFILVQHYLVR